MMLNAKDFFIDYIQKMGKEPTEEEWLQYIDDLAEEAERNREVWMESAIERMEHGDSTARTS